MKTHKKEEMKSKSLNVDIVEFDSEDDPDPVDIDSLLEKLDKAHTIVPESPGTCLGEEELEILLGLNILYYFWTQIV